MLLWSVSIDQFSSGEELAREIGCKFMESSAKLRINVAEAFYELVREIRRWRKEYGIEDEEKKQKKKKGCMIL